MSEKMEWTALTEFRWITTGGQDGPRVLQQLWMGHFDEGGMCPLAWRSVPVVTLTNDEFNAACNSTGNAP